MKTEFVCLWKERERESDKKKRVKQESEKRVFTILELHACLGLGVTFYIISIYNLTCLQLLFLFQRFNLYSIMFWMV